MRLYLGCALFALIVASSGCATSQLPNDATPAERHAALCMDATAGLAMAEAAMSTATDPEALRYWASFRRAAQIGVATYCGGGQ